MSSEVMRDEPRRRWVWVTVAVVGVIALAFYIGAFFIGHYIYGAH